MKYVFDFKIKIPNCIAGMISREELCFKLENSTEKVVVIKAGSGYGKTVSLAFFANRNKDKCAWYNLENEDDDFEVFVGYLSAAIQMVVPEFSFDHEMVYTSGKNRQRVNVAAYDFVLSLNRLHQPLVVIMDDFQSLSNEDIYQFLNILFEYTEDNIRFVIATNEEFPAFLSRAYLGGEIAAIGYEELQLSLEEISGRLERCGNVEQIGKCAAEILEYSEGWAIGVMSVILQISQERGKVNAHNIKNYCRQNKALENTFAQVYQKLPYDLQIFLVNTCVFDELTVGLCNYVLGIQNAKSNLEYFMSKNLFTIKIQDKAEVYRYHASFKRYLLSKVLPETERELLEKGARYYLLKNNQIKCAMYAAKYENYALVQDAVAKLDLQCVLETGDRITGALVTFLEQHEENRTEYTRLLLATYYQRLSEHERAQQLAKEILQTPDVREPITVIALRIYYVELTNEGRLRELKNTLEELGGHVPEYSYSWYYYVIGMAGVSLCLNEWEKAIHYLQVIVEATAGKIGKRYFENVVEIKTQAAAIMQDLKRLKNVGQFKEEKQLPGENRSSDKIQSQVEKQLQDEKQTQRAKSLQREEQIRAEKEISEITGNRRKEVNSLKGEYEDYFGSMFKSCRLWCEIEHTYGDYEASSTEIYEKLQKIDDISLYDNTFRANAWYLAAYYQWLEGNLTEFSRLYFKAEKYYHSAGILFPALKGKNSTLFLNKMLKNGQEVVSQNLPGKRTVTIDCFGKFEIAIDGEKISFRTRKAKELVAVLADKHGAGMTKDAIIDTLWPAEDAATDVTSLFYTTLSYARKAFKKAGVADIIRQRQKAYFINLDKVEMNYDQFMEMNDRIMKEKLVAIEAFEHFGDGYMADIDGMWAMGRREYYERIFKKSCLRLAEVYLECGDRENNIGVLEMAFRKDRLSEQLAIRLIESYVAGNDYKNAKNIYRSLEKGVKKELEMELSEEFIMKYRQLTEQKQV